MAHPPLIVVAGPTASGKSQLGVELAERLDGEVINADSMQLYRGMDIGTAKITAEEARGIRHHLLDVLEVTEEATASAYQRQARDVVADIRARGKTPIMVGGSGLYIRAAVDIIEFPPTDPDVRRQLEDRLQVEGPQALRAQLRAADPESAAVVQDDRRLIRALEVVTITGRPFTTFMPPHQYEPSVEPVVQLGLRVNREVLHQRIEDRVATMRRRGLLDEVRQLAAQGLRHGKTAQHAIGYQQFLRVLDGAISEDQAAEQTVTATRKFARRQETWFRADGRIHWLGAPAEDLTDRAEEAIRAATG
ncbi:tRNA (adenosine(37)-N6)-dimethylallyltransferase MiaA [Nesterenkonia alba]|uniref:tRNA (adenosine(37)-N6)-dimethylallyltransferase MiaA n=1 Tax=Nesterenkonia alba TaxID=515814 RepID=UPI0003B4A844|nr:tRNA (adenosine(37)-N6)-dimethylallyltransferase MiaA [Nesterenkonia alba]